MATQRTLAAALFSASVACAGVSPAGVRARGDPAALQAALAAAIAAGAPSFIVEPLLYNFSATSLHIYGARDMLIDGTGAEITFAGGAGFRVTNATRVELRGFEVDADPFFSSQGVVRDGSRDGKWFNYTLGVEEGVPPPALHARAPSSGTRRTAP